jgi:hypothetical protein
MTTHTTSSDKNDREPQEISDEEARQRDEVVKRMIATPPTPKDKPKKKART